MKKHPRHKVNKRTKQSKNKSYKKLFSTIAVIFISILLGLVIGSFYGTQIDEVTEDIKSIATIDIEHTEKQKNITFEEKTKALEIEYAENTNNTLYIEEPEEELKTNNTFHFEEPNLEEIDKKIEKEIEFISPKPTEKIKPITNIIEPNKKSIISKPKLVVIIDDVTTNKQVNSILNIGYSVNMSFLPPTSGHKNSAKITDSLTEYMIHLPLQASSSKYEEENTLYIDDSLEKMDKRIKELRTLYPNTDYLNNHTGSKFTSNQIAMDKLFQVLKKYNYTFLDSRTTSKSVAKKSSEKYGVKMFSRNIFLDNKKDKKYIQKQLKKAIKIAKKKGIAIAIGHPYGITFRTLKESKPLLKDLDLVYISQL